MTKNFRLCEVINERHTNVCKNNSKCNAFRVTTKNSDYVDKKCYQEGKKYFSFRRGRTTYRVRDNEKSRQHGSTIQ